MGRGRGPVFCIRVPQGPDPRRARHGLQPRRSVWPSWLQGAVVEAPAAGIRKRASRPEMDEGTNRHLSSSSLDKMNEGQGCSEMPSKRSLISDRPRGAQVGRSKVHAHALDPGSKTADKARLFCAAFEIEPSPTLLRLLPLAIRAIVPRWLLASSTENPLRRASSVMGEHGST